MVRYAGLVFASAIFLMGLGGFCYFMEQAFFDAETIRLGLRSEALFLSLPSLMFAMLGAGLCAFWLHRIKVVKKSQSLS